MDKCNICNTPLVIGRDGKQYIVRKPEDKARFIAGEITLEELDTLASIMYDRELLCPCNSNPQDDYKPCQNYYGGDKYNPLVVVETVSILDN